MMARRPCQAAAVKTCRATCALLLALLLFLSADVIRPPARVAAQAPEPEEAASTVQADGDGNGNGTRGGGGGARGGGGGGSGARKVVSTIDCQICEATCRVKCLVNNLFQWGVCYQRCKADNCNDWCR